MLLLVKLSMLILPTEGIITSPRYEIFNRSLIILLEVTIKKSSSSPGPKM